MTTAAEDSTTTPAEDTPPEALTDRPIHEARCEQCPVRVRFRSSASGAGFIVVDHSGTDAHGDQVTFGIGEHGRPLCPNGHGELALADEQLPAAEAFALAQEQLAQKPQRLPFPSPPFNYEGALHEIFEKQSEITRLEIKFNDADDRRKKARGALDEAREELSKMIDTIREREEDRLQELARRDADADAAALHPDGTNLVRCKWEDQHPGDQCPICSSDDVKPEAPRDSEGHVEEVATLLNLRAVVAIVDALADNVGIVVALQTVNGWADEDRGAVKAWAEFDRTSTDPVPPRPAILGTGHIASPYVEGQSGQFCTQCDATLIAAPEDGEAPNYYVPGIFVGVDCKGKPPARYAEPRKGGRRKKAEATAEGAE